MQTSLAPSFRVAVPYDADAIFVLVESVYLGDQRTDAAEINAIPHPCIMGGVLLDGHQGRLVDSCQAMRMTVSVQCEELMVSYSRHGCWRTGGFQPFFCGDPRLVIAPRDDLHFQALQKTPPA